MSVSPSPVPSSATGEQFTLSLQNHSRRKRRRLSGDCGVRYLCPPLRGEYQRGLSLNGCVLCATGAATSLSGTSHGDSTLATVTFEVVAAKASTLTLSDAILSDSAGAGSRPQIEGRTGTAQRRWDGVVNIQDLVLVASALGNTGAVLAMLTITDVKGWLTQAQHRGLTNPAYLRGIAVLEQPLVVLTPQETILLPNYPNPFNPETWIPYHPAHAADVQITVYDTQVVVRRLVLGPQPAGYYTFQSKAAYWDGCNESGESVASGFYFYQLQAGDYTALRRMVIVKLAWMRERG